jgi:phosphohistidine swiveling domain-containing protein
MTWLGRLLRPTGGSEALTLLKLRVTRYRQLLRRYGSLQSLIEDAAEKQGGGFILDRQYVVSLAEQVVEIADAVVFDLNVLTSQRNLPFYEQVERLRSELRSLLAEEGTGTPAGLRKAASSTVPPAALAAALARARVLYRGRGQVACRGLAAGPVWNLGPSTEPEAVPEGCVLVAADLSAGPGALDSMKRAGAVLLDRGAVGGPAARRARELRLPAILGLEDATSLLASGGEVTVDADENVVYQGRVAELLDYGLSTRAAGEEEPEYALLRSVRRAAFSLTLAVDRAAPALGDCRSLHDLVHLAQSLAGDAMAELLAARRSDAGAELRRAGGPGYDVHVIRLERLPGRSEASEAHPAEPPSRPLKALLAGLADSRNSDGHSSGRPPSAIDAVATEEHALAVLELPGGFDLLDATAAGAGNVNNIYCRFAPRGNGDAGGARGALAAGVLARLGFAVARTGRDVSGWVHGLPSGEIETRLSILGRLRTRLAGQPPSGRADAGTEAEVTALLGSLA